MRIQLAISISVCFLTMIFIVSAKEENDQHASDQTARNGKCEYLDLEVVKVAYNAIVITCVTLPITFWQ